MFSSIFKYWIVFILPVVCQTSHIGAQRFTFNPEIGLACSQMDGDWLQGFDKQGLTVGLSSYYYVNDVVHLGFGAKYNRLGSDTGASKQDKPSGAFQFTTAFTSASIGTELVIAPTSPKFKLGAGITLNRIFGFRYRSLVQLDSLSRFQIEEQDIITDYIGYNFSAHIRLMPQVYSRISFNKSFTSILTSSRANDARQKAISTLNPYYLAFSLYYEFDVNSKRKKTNRKKKRRE